MHEAMQFIDPIFKFIISIFCKVIGLAWLVQKSIRTMHSTFDMNEGKMKCKNQHNPSIDTSRKLDVRVLEHSFDITCICFDNQVSNANNIKVQAVEHSIESIDF